MSGLLDDCARENRRLAVKAAEKSRRDLGERHPQTEHLRREVANNERIIDGKPLIRKASRLW